MTWGTPILFAIQQAMRLTSSLLVQAMSIEISELPSLIPAFASTLGRAPLPLITITSREFSALSARSSLSSMMMILCPSDDKFLATLYPTSPAPTSTMRKMDLRPFGT